MALLTAGSYGDHAESAHHAESASELQLRKEQRARWCAVPLVRGAMDGRAHRERRHALLVRVREADLRARLRRRRRASAPRANRRERAQRLRQRAALRGFTS